MSRTTVGYSVAPMLSVRNGARAVEFYKSAFGATEVFRIEAPDGAVVARLGLFSSVLATVFYHSTVTRLFQGLAASVLGKQALDGGIPTALLSATSSPRS
jgi:hypothetical protein